MPLSITFNVCDFVLVYQKSSTALEKSGWDLPGQSPRNPLAGLHGTYAFGCRPVFVMFFPRLLKSTASNFVLILRNLHLATVLNPSLVTFARISAVK